MDHPFKVKPSVGKKKIKHVCLCGKNRLHPCHGAFSWNQYGSGANRFTYQETKKAWSEMYVSLLDPLGLPRPVSFIEVQGRICFPDGKDRDEDNFRYPYSKFLGDALQAGGWLKSDGWDSFRFRQLDRVPCEPGQQWTELMIMASL